MQAAGPDRSGRRGRHRPVGQRRGGRRVRAHRPRAPSRDRSGHPLPRRAGAGPPRSRSTSPSSACPSARCTPCWPPGRPWATTPPSPCPTPTTSTARRPWACWLGPADRRRRARARRLPAVGDRRHRDPVTRGICEVDGRGLPRPRSPRGAGSPGTKDGDRFRSDDGREPSILDGSTADVGQPVGVPARDLGRLGAGHGCLRARRGRPGGRRGTGRRPCPLPRSSCPRWWRRWWGAAMACRCGCSPPTRTWSASPTPPTFRSSAPTSTGKSRSASDRAPCGSGVTR